MSDQRNFQGKVRFTKVQTTSFQHLHRHPNANCRPYSSLVALADWVKSYPRHWRLEVSALFHMMILLLKFSDEAGAHVTIFARRQGPLQEARTQILAARRDENQEVHAVSLDLGNPAEVRPISPR